uniref:Bromo domain-containing protein n=1 Tax=Aegilops tauschii subsp. strangulata TaxID=200361 RepID=A0A452ZR23_AEGTS
MEPLSCSQICFSIFAISIRWSCFVGFFTWILVVVIHIFGFYFLQIITKPMDFSTIRNKMEGKESTTYNSVREIYSDVRLVFTNAMKYNVEGHPVNIMAKFLLERFEEKWLHLLPKVENEVDICSHIHYHFCSDLDMCYLAFDNNKLGSILSGKGTGGTK